MLDVKFQISEISVSNFSVSDGEYSAATDAMINITLTDENDLSPVFDPAEYTVSLTSNINNGSYITMFLIKVHRRYTCIGYQPIAAWRTFYGQIVYVTPHNMFSRVL